MRQDNFNRQQLDLFQDRLPARPYCTDELGAGLLIRDKMTALKKRYIQHNPPPLIAFLVYDIDRPGASHAWVDAMLPPPAWVATNPANGHAHIAYGMVAPICRTAAARQEPMRLAAAVECAYRDALQADHGYAGLITKNPLHDDWRIWQPANAGYYDLSELAEYVQLPQKLTKRDLDVGLGRNVALFDHLRTWSYSAVRDYWRPAGFDAWAAAVFDRACGYNVFASPLPMSEVKATASSVSRWVWKNFSPASLQALIARTHTSEIQSARGKKSGVARRKGSAQERQPWLDMGISERTWYRMKKQGLCG